jgi:hypothetical protein
MWTRLGFAEKMRTAGFAKSPMHSIAAIGNALKIGKLAFDGDRCGWKTGVDGPAAGAKVLAQTTPTHSRHDWCGVHRITNGTA